MEISVNIDATTLKFCMKPPSIQSLKFRKNQLGETCENHFWVIKEPSFSNLKDKWGQQDDPSAPEGYHYSPLPLSPIISSAFALWANAELYKLVHSLTNLLCGPPCGKKLEISINIDARTLKFGRNPPCTQPFRFREKKLGRVCGFKSSDLNN